MDVERIVRIGKALANPQRVRILALLSERPHNVSQLAKAMQLSRPVINMHLTKLAQAGFVEGVMELEGTTAMKNYHITTIDIKLSEQQIREAS